MEMFKNIADSSCVLFVDTYDYMGENLAEKIMCFLSNCCMSW